MFIECRIYIVIYEWDTLGHFQYVELITIMLAQRQIKFSLLIANPCLGVKKKP